MKSNPNNVSGSALVETTILMLVMLPVVFGLAMVGNLIDLKQTTEQAARYSAWESTVYPDASANSTSVDTVNDRFFAVSESPISSQPNTSAQNRLWGSQGLAIADLQSRSEFTIDESSLTVAYGASQQSSTLSMKIGQTVGRSGEFLEGVSGNAWGLTAEGLTASTVGININASEWLPSGGADCAAEDGQACLSSQAAILSDGWSASDDEQARQRVRSLMPASVLEPIGNAVSVVGHLPLFNELKDLRGAFGHVDMTVLPEYESR